MQSQCSCCTIGSHLYWKTIYTALFSRPYVALYSIRYGGVTIICQRILQLWLSCMPERTLWMAAASSAPSRQALVPLSMTTCVACTVTSTPLTCTPLSPTVQYLHTAHPTFQYLIYLCTQSSTCCAVAECRTNPTSDKLCSSVSATNDMKGTVGPHNPSAQDFA
jgi:hypothetical protein